MRALLQDVKISVKIGVTDYWRDSDKNEMSSSGAKLYVKGSQTMDALLKVCSVMEESDIEVAPYCGSSLRFRESVKAPPASH